MKTFSAVSTEKKLLPHRSLRDRLQRFEYFALIVVYGVITAFQIKSMAQSLDLQTHGKLATTILSDSYEWLLYCGTMFGLLLLERRRRGKKTGCLAFATAFVSTLVFVVSFVVF